MMGTTRRQSRVVKRFGLALLLAVALVMGCSEDRKEPAPSKAGATIEGSQQHANAEAAKRAAERARHEAAVRDILRTSLNASARRHVSGLVNAPHYDLTVETVGKLGYRGTERLTYTNRTGKPLSELYFFLYPNSDHVGANSGAELVVSDVTVDGKDVHIQRVGATLRVPLSQPLRAGDQTVVAMKFDGRLVRQADGSSDMWKLALEQLMQMFLGGDQHQSGYGIYSYGDGITSMGLWYPVVSSFRDGEWDLAQGGTMGDVSYFDASNYRVQVTASPGDAIATTGVERSRTVENGRLHIEYVAGGVREFCVQLSPKYRSISEVVDGVKVTSWFLPEHEKTGRRVLKQGAQALRFFNQRFGPYPYIELDLAEAPLVGGAGGVEFPGLVTLASMFYGSSAGASGLPKMFEEVMDQNPMMHDTLEFVVAHEVAHQWWNAVVGSDSKQHPFVDEALANHAAILYFEHQHGTKARDTQIELQLRIPYQIARLAGAQDRPVDLPTESYASMLEYSAIVYGKGGLFFDVLRKDVGNAAHDRFLRTYYDRFAFQTASPDDLIGGLVAAAPQPEKARRLAERWLRGSHGDEDIGPLQLSAFFRTVLGEDAVNGPMAHVVKMLDHQGVQELAKLIQNFMGPDGSLKESVDYGSILQLILRFLSPDSGGSDVTGLLNDLLSIGDKGNTEGGGTVDVLQGILSGLAGDDTETKDLIKATGTLLKVLESLD